MARFHHVSSFDAKSCRQCADTGVAMRVDIGYGMCQQVIIRLHLGVSCCGVCFEGFLRVLSALGDWCHWKHDQRAVQWPNPLQSSFH
jgi:hypothetical protein